jgi:hypothetical protein
MSLGYAEKLSYIEDVGNVGMTEHFDPSHVLLEKVSLFSSFMFFCHLFYTVALPFSWMMIIFIPFATFFLCLYVA